VVAARDGTTGRNLLYVDGVLEADAAVPGGAGYAAEGVPMDVGWLDLSGGFHYDGDLDEVAIYDRVLEPGEVAAHHAAGLGGLGYCAAGVLAPTIVSTPVTGAIVGEPYVYDVDAIGNPAPAYALTTAPAGTAIDPASGLITWEPEAIGDAPVTVTATNAEGSDTQTFTVTVTTAPVCPEGMAAYWQLEETDGTVYADLYDGLDGQAAVSAPTPDPGGIVGGCQDFDGVGDFITVADDPALDWSADASFTIELWANLTNVAGRNKVMIGRDEDGGYPHWWLGASQSTGYVNWNLLDENREGVALAGTTPLNDGVWHHLVAVRDGAADENRLYVDGVLVDSATHDYTAGFGASTSLGIGYMAYNHNPDYYYDGKLDEIALYDVALTEAQIQTHYTDGLAGQGYCSEGPLPPVIVSLPVTDAQVGEPYSYQVEASGEPSYTLTVAPAGMTIDPTGGLILWSPTEAGDFPVEVEASNASGSDTQAFTITVAPAPACPPQTLHRWALDEMDGAPYADAVGAADAGCVAGCPEPLAGQIGGALWFDGADDEVDAPDLDTLEWDADASFSIAVWMRTGESTAGNRVIVGRDATDTPLHWWLGASDDGRAHLGLKDTGGHYEGCTGSSVINDDAWHQVVAVRDGATDENRIYVDGVLENTVVHDYTAGFTGNAPVNLGYLDLGGHYRYHGALDEVVILAHALTTAEVAQLHLNGRAAHDACEAFAPEIVSVPGLAAQAAQAYAYDVDAAGNPAPVYALTAAPDGMTIDAATGVISWLPPAAGEVEVAVAASNALGSAEQTWTIVVAAEPVCPDGITHTWHLDAAGGPYADGVGDADATCTGDCPTRIDGLLGGAQWFDGSNDEVSAPDDGTLDWAADASFTITYWIRTGESTAGNRVIVGRDGDGVHWWLGCGDDGTATFQLRDSGGEGLFLTGEGDPVNDDAWHLIGCVRDGTAGENRLYVDGELIASGTHTHTADFASSAPLNLGFLNLGGHYRYHGALDAVAIYDRALGQDELQTQYLCGLAGYDHCTQLLPMFTSTPPDAATVGEPYTYDADALGNPWPTFALPTAPGGMVIDPVSGLVTWPAPTAGEHEVVVAATNALGTTTQTYTLVSGFTEAPAILAIADIAGDEGGQVRLRWRRSLHDAADHATEITGYGVYRREPGAVAKAAPPADRSVDRLAKLDGWDYVETVPARGDALYQCVVPTLCDSTALEGPCWSVFFVSAMTDDPLVFYDSPPDSGQSTDDLAPLPPGAFTVQLGAQGHTLQWLASTSRDLRAYHVHRAQGANFTPSSGNLVATVTEPRWFDDLTGWSGDPQAVRYRVAAQDSAGNVSEAVAPQSVDAPAIPRRFALHGGAPNPFNPRTRIRWDLPGACEVSLTIYDLAGRCVRRLVADEWFEAGEHARTWNGRDQAGRTLPAGAYFCRLDAGSFHQTRRLMLVR
jgi:PKD repeat protein